MSLPLAGWKIAITRPREQSEELASRIVAEGGEALLYPLIEIAFRDKTADFLQALDDPFDFAVFTSANGVHAFQAGLRQRGASMPIGVLAYCVGSATARAASQAGFATQALPKVFAAENLPEVLGPPTMDRARALLVRGNLADATLSARLALLGYTVIDAVGYETVTTDAATRLWADALKQEVDVITFYSGSAVKTLLFPQTERLPAHCVLAAVGPKTAEVIAKYGYAPQVVASTASTEALMEALITYKHGGFQ